MRGGGQAVGALAVRSRRHRGENTVCISYPLFGQQEIIAHIMNRDPANYLIVSGRQLGKSSLLKALERRYKEQPDVACFYLALSSEVLVPRLASALGLSHGAGLEEIAAYVANIDGRCLFLIDEADKFVRHELEKATEPSKPYAV
jgi:hypothetical protein